MTSGKVFTVDYGDSTKPEPGPAKPASYAGQFVLISPSKPAAPNYWGTFFCTGQSGDTLELVAEPGNFPRTLVTESSVVKPLGADPLRLAHWEQAWAAYAEEAAKATRGLHAKVDAVLARLIQFSAPPATTLIGQNVDFASVTERLDVLVVRDFLALPEGGKYRVLTVLDLKALREQAKK